MPLPSQREKLREFLKAYGLALVVVAAVIIGLTLLTVHHAQRHHEDREIARLQAVAELKARQIADWLSERRADAIYASASAYLAQQYQGYRHGDIAGDGACAGRGGGDGVERRHGRGGRLLRGSGRSGQQGKGGGD